MGGCPKMAQIELRACPEMGSRGPVRSVFTPFRLYPMAFFLGVFAALGPAVGSCLRLKWPFRAASYPAFSQGKERLPHLAEIVPLYKNTNPPFSAFFYKNAEGSLILNSQRMVNPVTIPVKAFPVKEVKAIPPQSGESKYANIGGRRRPERGLLSLKSAWTTGAFFGSFLPAPSTFSKAAWEG